MVAGSVHKSIIENDETIDLWKSSYRIADTS